MDIKEKILLVDDNHMMLSFLGGYLGHEYELYWQENGVEAWKLLSDGFQPHLIILDIIMPNGNGLELLEKIKSSLVYRSIPVIMLSGVHTTIEKIRCLELGAADYIEKPFNPKELEFRIKKCLMLDVDKDLSKRTNLFGQ